MPIVDQGEIIPLLAKPRRRCALASPYAERAVTHNRLACPNAVRHLVTAPGLSLWSRDGSPVR